jgi:hypothetical protein
VSRKLEKPLLLGALVLLACSLGGPHLEDGRALPDRPLCAAAERANLTPGILSYRPALSRSAAPLAPFLLALPAIVFAPLERRSATFRDARKSPRPYSPSSRGARSPPLG